MKTLPPPPRISIVIPMFNAQKYIGQCVESILMQNFRDFELIVIDDHSTDGSLEVVEKYDDYRIKTFRNVQNLGTGLGRNVGLSMSRGKYVYFVDADDVLMPQMLESFYNAAEESQAEVVCIGSHYRSVQQDFELGKIQIQKISSRDPRPRFFSENLVERLQNELIDFGMIPGSPWLKFYRRDFLLEHDICFHPIPIHEDWIMNVETLCLAKKFQMIDACYYIYRANFNSLAHSSAEKYLSLAPEVVSKTIAQLEVLFTKKLIQPLSRENQIILESFVPFGWFKDGFIAVQSAYHGKLALEKMDQILREITLQPIAMNPNLMRVMIQAYSTLLSFLVRQDPNQKKVFELKQ